MLRLEAIEKRMRELAKKLPLAEPWPSGGAAVAKAKSEYEALLKAAPAGAAPA